MEPAQPSKADIESVFSRLRTIAANKVCFDCSAKNPTWSSVTYGVFICIDCSAVHRSLGVHLTFVRSTQLDTNWTWVQLRQMQLGGNSNATQFFTRHNCVTTDAQKKYNSRAAQLYRDKLQQLAINNLKTNNQLHIHPHVEEPVEEKEADFFADHENFATPDGPQPPPTKEIEKGQSLQQTSEDPEEGPTVNFSLSAPVTPNENNARKSTISARKPTNKKPGLGAKKGSLGATRVKTNFAELEREAEITEENRLRSLEESARAAAAAQKAQEEREAAVRLAYKDLSTEQTKKEEQIRRQDPKKAEQVERLGMGVGARTGISHSAVSDMQVIEQENVKSSSGRSTINDLRRMKLSDNQNETGGAASSSFFDDFSSFDSGFSMNRNTSGGGGGGGGMTFSKIDSLMSESSNNNNNNNSGSNNVTSYGSKNSDGARDRDYNSRKERDNNSSWVIVEDPMEKPKRSSASRNASDRNSATTDAAQKKFGNAKAISSDQYFNDREADYETKANLNRFQGSSSISSAEFFGNGKDNVHPNSLQAYDLDDVKESVRQGVTKVAGKISSLANGVMSSLQDRYGY